MRAKIQNTELRIEHSTFNGQWKIYRYFPENLGPLVSSNEHLAWSVRSSPVLSGSENGLVVDRSRDTTIVTTANLFNFDVLLTHA